MFLLNLQRFPNSQWATLNIPSLPAELTPICLDLLIEPAPNWLIKLLLSVMILLKPEQINDHRLIDAFFKFISTTSTKLSPTELQDLLSSPSFRNELSLQNVSLLTAAPRDHKTASTDNDSKDTDFSSSPDRNIVDSSVMTSSIILDKYNKLVQKENWQKQTTGTGAHGNLQGLSEQTTNRLVRLIESEIPTGQELFLLAMRFMINMTIDRLATNYCKDYQLVAIISGALEQYQCCRIATGDNKQEKEHQSQQQSRKLLQSFWSSMLALAVVEYFAPTLVSRRKPKELLEIVDKVFETGCDYLTDDINLTEDNAHTTATWLFLVTYLLNNLQYCSTVETNEKVKLQSLWNKFSDLEEKITRILKQFLITDAKETRIYAMNIVNLLIACLENKKLTPSNNNLLRNRRRRRNANGKCKQSMRSHEPVHHQPTLGAYKRFECIAEQILMTVLSDCTVDDQRKLLKRMGNVVCCCNANLLNLSVLWKLSFNPLLTEKCLHILRTSVYSLWFSGTSDCRLCLERGGDNESLHNELLKFYRDSVESMPQRRTLLVHVLESLKTFPFTVRLRLVLDVVWRHFSNEMGRKCGTDDTLQHCLMIFSRALELDRDLVKMFVTEESVAMLLDCRSKWPELSNIVNGIFLSALQNSKKIKPSLTHRLLKSIVEPCVEITQWVKMFLRQKVKTRIGKDGISNENINLIGLPFGTNNMESIALRTVHLWTTVGEIMDIKDEDLDDYLDEHFFAKTNVFEVVCLALVFALDVNQSESDQMNRNVRTLSFDDISQQLDSLRLEQDCDKCTFLLRRADVTVRVTDKVKATTIDQMKVTCAYQRVSVLLLPIGNKNNIVGESYEEVIVAYSVINPFSCDIMLKYWVDVESELKDNDDDDEVEIRREKTEIKDEKRNSLSLVVGVLNSVKETTGRLINQYVGDHWKGGVQEMERDINDHQLLILEEMKNVKVSAKLRMRFGQLLDVALNVFARMNSEDDVGK